MSLFVQVCWVDPPSGESNAPAWTGSDFGDGDASVVVPAMDFDRLVRSLDCTISRSHTVVGVNLLQLYFCETPTVSGRVVSAIVVLSGAAKHEIPNTALPIQWPKLAPRIPAPEDTLVPAPKIELPEQKAAPADLLPLPEPSQADRAAEGQPEPSQAAKPVEARQTALPKAASASRQAADHAALRIAQDADGGLPAGISEVLDLGIANLSY